MSTFTKIKGMSYTLGKLISECTEDEKLYKQSYSRYIKERYINRKSPEKHNEYNSSYYKQYYEINKEDLKLKARVRMSARRAREKGEGSTSESPKGSESSQLDQKKETRGRKNKSGIHVQSGVQGCVPDL